jgi:hypothetical protein
MTEEEDKNKLGERTEDRERGKTAKKGREKD